MKRHKKPAIQQGSYTGKVLVLGSDSRSFLSVVRSLGRMGLRVDAAWTDGGSIALHSRYLNEVHEIPRPWKQPDQWFGPFNDLLQSQQYDLVVPCNDPSLIPLQNYRRELFRSDSIYLLDDPVFETTQSKVLSTELAESLGIRTARNQVGQTVEDVREFAALNGFPVVMKPIQSYRTERLDRKQTVTVVRNEEQLELEAQRQLKHASIQLQEYFEGIGTGVEFLAKDGEILLAFQHKRLHEPIDGGGSSYRMSIPLQSTMMEASKKLIASLDYSGVGMVEFLWNQATDEWIFVEINGRFWGSLPLAIASRADFPKFLYQSRVDGINTFPQEYRTGVCCRNWERDKNWFSEQLSSRGPLRFLKTLGIETVLAMLRSLTFRAKSDTFVWDDLNPAWAEFRSITGSIVTGGRSKVESKIRKTSVHRSQRHRRLVSHVAATRSFLFVCKGNICRSPFAAFYAQTRLPKKISIASAGYIPKSNRPSPQNAQEAAQQFGISLADHRSVEVNSQMVSTADLVIVFDEENLIRLKRDFPNATDKIFLLNQIQSSGNLIIDDPYGGSVKQFVSTYAEIKQSIDALATKTTDLESQHVG